MCDIYSDFSTVTCVPVRLCGQRAHGLGGAGPRHQAAALQVQASASAALPQQLLDGQRLDDRLAQAQLRGLRAGLAAQLQAQVHADRLLALLGDGGQRGRLRGAVAEVGVLQRADVLRHPETKVEYKKETYFTIKSSFQSLLKKCFYQNQNREFFSFQTSPELLETQLNIIGKWEVIKKFILLAENFVFVPHWGASSDTL